MLKRLFPIELAVTLLLEANIDYDVLVQVMDATRSYRVDEPGEIERAELFPEISIGDAPILAAAPSRGWQSHDVTACKTDGEAPHARKNVGGLNLISLMDIFTILVFFLLVNSQEVETLPNAKDIQLPESYAEQKARENVVVMITDEQILVQGKPIVTMAEVEQQKGVVIERLSMSFACRRRI